MVRTCPEKVLAIGRFMKTLILEVGAGFEFYVSGVIIVITRQRPKPLHSSTHTASNTIMEGVES